MSDDPNVNDENPDDGDTATEGFFPSFEILDEPDRSQSMATGFSIDLTDDD